MDTLVINSLDTPTLYDGELPVNFEQKCPVVLLLDISASMSGSPINELNKGLKVFEQDIQEDDITSARLDMAIVTFGSSAAVAHDFGVMQDYVMPHLTVSGSTNLEAGFRTAMELLEDRKGWYHNSQQTYYRPYIILITDGAPDQDPDVTGLTAHVKAAVNNGAFNFWPIGVKGANMQLLNRMACPEVKGSLPAQPLDGLNFVELFQWLSSSLSKISLSGGKRVDITPEAGKNPFMFSAD
jgi:uncharacterized protein YegL